VTAAIKTIAPNPLPNQALPPVESPRLDAPSSGTVYAAGVTEQLFIIGTSLIFARCPLKFSVLCLDPDGGSGAGLCRILLEISLLDSAYMRSGTSDNLLTDVAKRYRADLDKLEKAVVAEFAAKRSNEAKTKPRTKSVT
jgi:hypothetical protein